MLSLFQTKLDQAAIQFISRSGYSVCQAMSEVHSAAEIGQRVRQTLQKLGLTQPQLALAVGVGIRFIVDLEAGKSTVRLDKVLQVLAGLGLTLRISDSPNSTATDV